MDTVQRHIKNKYVESKCLVNQSNTTVILSHTYNKTIIENNEYFISMEQWTNQDIYENIQISNNLYYNLRT